jgi:peptide/nickel transport system substrate-binding protein
MLLQRREHDMNLKKISALFIAAILTTTVFAGCAKKENTNSAANTTKTTNATTNTVTARKVLRYAESNPKNSLDMQTNTSSKVAVISDHITEALLRYDEELKLQTVLLSKLPTVSSDGLTYSFELKPNVKFHDGTTLKSSDVKFTFERMFTPSTGALSAYYYNMIKGAKEMLAGQATSLEGFKVIDDTKFEVTLTAPYTPFISNLAISYAEIFPEDAVKKAGKDWGIKTLIGTGPFKLKENNPDSGVVLVRNDEYHGTKQQLDEIQVKYIDDPNTQLMEYEKGNFDVVALDTTLYKSYAENPKFKDQINPYQSLSTTFLNVNNNDKVFSNAKVREALSYAVNREEITNFLLNGTATPATTFLNPKIPGFNKDAKAYEYSTQKSKDLLKEAGYANGIQVTATVSSTDANATKIFTAIQGQVKEAGIDLKIESMDAATFNAKKAEGSLQLYLAGWSALYPDGDNQMYSYLFSSSSKTKSLNYNNPKFDELVTKARISLDEKERAELYKQADEIVTRNDYAVIPLYNQKSYFLAKPYVKNMKIGNLIYHFFDVDINTELQSKK